MLNSKLSMLLLTTALVMPTMTLGETKDAETQTCPVVSEAILKQADKEAVKMLAKFADCKDIHNDGVFLGRIKPLLEKGYSPSTLYKLLEYYNYDVYDQLQAGEYFDKLVEHNVSPSDIDLLLSVKGNRSSQYITIYLETLQEDIVYDAKKMAAMEGEAMISASFNKKIPLRK